MGRRAQTTSICDTPQVDNSSFVVQFHRFHILPHFSTETRSDTVSIERTLAIVRSFKGNKYLRF